MVEEALTRREEEEGVEEEASGRSSGLAGSAGGEDGLRVDFTEWKRDRARSAVQGGEAGSVWRRTPWDRIHHEEGDAEIWTCVGRRQGRLLLDGGRRWAESNLIGSTPNRGGDAMDGARTSRRKLWKEVDLVGVCVGRGEEEAWGWVEVFAENFREKEVYPYEGSVQVIIWAALCWSVRHLGD